MVPTLSRGGEFEKIGSVQGVEICKIVFMGALPIHLIIVWALLLRAVRSAKNNDVIVETCSPSHDITTRNLHNYLV